MDGDHFQLEFIQCPLKPPVWTFSKFCLCEVRKDYYETNLNFQPLVKYFFGKIAILLRGLFPQAKPGGTEYDTIGIYSIGTFGDFDAIT